MKEEIIRCGRIAFEHGLLAGASGNLSARTPDNMVHITASGSYLGFLRPADIISFRCASQPPAGCSMETQLHLNCYAARPATGAVFHSQPHYATLLACSNEELNINLVPETMYYLKSIGRIGYAHPGSPELAKLTGEAAAKHDVVIMGNHGLTAVGKDLNDALLKTIAFEFLARAILTARSANLPLQYQSASVRAELLHVVDRLKKV